MYSRSPVAYEALKSWGIFKLPSKSALKKFTTAHLQYAGPYYDFLKDEAEKYAAYKKEVVARGWIEPNGEGALILDEVKVIGKVMWNSKNGQICGLAMNEEDIINSVDLSKGISLEDHPAEKEEGSGTTEVSEYVLQFLWRDLSSDRDVIGPHYPTARSMSADFTAECFMDALHAFQSFRFKVSNRPQGNAICLL